MSFAAGIGAGIAVGIATGIAAGQKKARDDIYRYVETNHITIQSDTGEPVPVKTFLEAALRASFQKNRGLVILGIFLGVVLLGILIGIVFFLLSNSA